MKQGRAGISGRLGAIQPDDIAGVAVKSAAGPSGIEDNKSTPEQWRAGKTPAVGNDTITTKVMLPYHGAICGVETEYITPFADGEHAIALDGRRRYGAAIMIHSAEFRFVGMLPKRFSRQGVEAPDDLLVI